MILVLGVMYRSAVALAALLQAACSDAPDALQVKLLKQGLMRQDEAGNWYVYQPARSMLLETNGRCSAAGEMTPCMWHGVELEWEMAQDAVELDCVAAIDPPTRVVTPRGVEAEETGEFAFKWQLKGQRGRQSFPGYDLPSGAFSSTLTKVTCRVGSNVVLQYGFLVTERGAAR